jgi:hypothetical protein
MFGYAVARDLLGNPFFGFALNATLFMVFTFLAIIALAKYAILDIRVLWFSSRSTPDPLSVCFGGVLILASTSE